MPGLRPAPLSAPGRSCVVLGFGDVPCLRTLRAVYDLEFDRLTLFKGPEAVATDRGVVHEYIAATLALNESIPLRVVEPLDLACDAHRSSSLLAKRSRCEQWTRWISCILKPQMSFEAQKKDRESLRGLDCDIRGTPLECSLILSGA
jgi:hypothetical protein